MRLQALAGEIVDCGPVVLFPRREQAHERFIFTRQLAELVRHLRPGFAEGLGSGRVGLSGCLLQRGAHRLDLADPRAHLDRQIDGKIPDVIGREILEHGPLSVLDQGSREKQFAADK